MDPTLMTLVATILGAVVSIVLGRVGSIDRANIAALTAPKNYNDRWDDPQYVAMIHSTIASENELLDGAVTVCECKACRNAPSIATPAEGRKELLPTPAKHSRKGRREVIFDGWVFTIPDIVPDGADISQYRRDDGPALNFAVFTWFDTKGVKWTHLVSATRRARRDEMTTVGTIDGDPNLEQMIKNNIITAGEARDHSMFTPSGRRREAPKIKTTKGWK